VTALKRAARRDDERRVSEELFGPALRAHLRRQDGAADGLDPEAAAAEDHRRLQALAAREQELADLQHRLAEASTQARRQQEELAAREQELARREAVFADANRRPVREVLRERAEMFADRLWTVFDEAIEAAHADGHPDHVARLSAVQALLSEAYTPTRAAHERDVDHPFDVPESLR
jgi:hypothetical protein